MIIVKISDTSNRLKQIMKERRLKQVDIIEMCKPFCLKYDVKLGKNDLSQYVSGKVQPGQEKLTILGLALNVSEAWLMGYGTEYVSKEFECQPPDFAIDKPEPNLNSLTPSEQKLLEDYRSLNDEGKEKVEDYAEDLAASGRYIKNYSAEMGQEKAN